MHASAYEACRRFLAKYPIGARVLDVGSLDVNGTLKPLFEGQEYVGLDLSEGPNVDVVSGCPFPFADGSFETVVSSSCLEHDPAFWITFAEMARVSRRWVYLCVPSEGGYHGYPGDCWRFLADSMPALAQWAGVELIESYVSAERPWCDCVGVFCVG